MKGLLCYLKKKNGYKLLKLKSLKGKILKDSQGLEKRKVEREREKESRYHSDPTFQLWEHTQKN